MLLPCDFKSLEPTCAEIERWREKLDAKGPLPRAWGGRLRRDLEAEAVAASTQMEGVPVTLEEVRRILAGDRPAEVSDESKELVEGYRDAMGFVLRRADDPHMRWDRELLVTLHDRVLAGSYPHRAGRLRTGPRFVVNTQTGEQIFLPPAAELVPQLLDQACAYVESVSTRPPLIAAWIHVAIAAIHPFSDGNGRVARIAAAFAMYRGGFRRPQFTSLEEWWGNHKSDYYSAFACLGSAFDPSTDVTPFCRAHIAAQLSQIRALDLREQVERQIWVAIENALLAGGLTPRLANALWDAFSGNQVTAGYYRAIADVSPATATADLATATASGFLRAVGNRRGRRYLAGDRLFQELGATFGIVLSSTDHVARRTLAAAIAERVQAGQR